MKKNSKEVPPAAGRDQHGDDSSGEWEMFKQGKSDGLGQSHHFLGTETDIAQRKLAQEEPSKTRGLLEAVFAASRDGILVERNEHIAYTNRAFARLFEYESQEEIIGKHVSIFISEEDTARMLEFGRKRDRGEQAPSLYSFTGKKKDGSRLDLEASVSTARVAGKWYIAAVVRDITARKSAEEKLRKLSHVVEQSHVSITITDIFGKIEYVNAKFAEITGYSFEEVHGKSLQILTSAPTPQGMYQELWKTISSGAEWRGELQNRTKNGELYWEHLTISPIRNAEGVVTHYLVEEVDITEQALIKERNREQAELLNITADALMVLDIEDKVVFWNKGAQEIYGWSAEEINGQDITRFAVESSSPNYADVKRAVMRNGNWRGELTQARKDGRKVTVEGRYVLQRGTTGAPKSMLVVSTDITEKKVLENRFYHGQRLESLGALAGGVAHDLNNLLSTILLSAEILKKNSLSEKDQRVVESIMASTERGTDIIKQVLTFARSAEGEREEIHLKHIVNEIGQVIEETFPKSIRLQLNVPKTMWMITADATQLHQVLLNLCMNARDSMPQGGVLQISIESITIDEQYARMSLTAKPGLYVVLDVSDTGTGIRPDILNKIFDPFFTTKPVGKGTGLGLATVNSIVKNHNGFINIYSIVGKGTTFKVYFPATSLTETAEVQKGRLEFPSGHGELILLVDDEVSLLDVTRQTLELHGYSTLTAMDGTEALAHYVQHKGSIRAVITDVIMPHLDGVATIRALRKIDGRVRIIAMSGLSIGDQINQSIRPEVEAFLQKPYTAEKLLKTVHKVLVETPRYGESNSQP